MDQDKDVLAAEYVLGTLGGDERAEAQALIAIDPAFADVVRGWERRLGELSAMVDPVEPPADMWDRIKAGVAIADRSTASTPPAPEAPKPAPPELPTPPVPDVPKTAAVQPPDLAQAEPPPPPLPPPPVEAAAAPAVEAPPIPEVPAPAVKAAVEPPAPVTAAAERPSSVAPPVVVSRARETDGEVVQLRRRVTRWQSATALIGALAACFAAVVLVRETNPSLLPAALQPKPKIVEVVRTVEVPSPRPAEFVAIFQKDDASPAFLLTFDLDKRMLTVSRVGAEPQAGKSYELWLVSDKFPAPRSLGVVGSAAYTVKQPAAEYDPVVINRATYAISLEPEGGSPTGAPTGPVLYHGRLLRTTAPDVPRGLP
jgi:anti-sigma-K factor RskA